MPEDFWVLRSKNNTINLMCENSNIFGMDDKVRCQVFSQGNDVGSIVFTKDQMTVFSQKGDMKESVLYGGGYPIRISMSKRQARIRRERYERTKTT